MSEQVEEKLYITPMSEAYLDRYLKALADRAGMPTQFLQPGLAKMAELMAEDRMVAVKVHSERIWERLNHHISRVKRGESSGEVFNVAEVLD